MILGRVDRHRAQRGHRVQALLDRQRGLVDEEVDRHHRVVGGDRDRHPGGGEPARVGQRPVTQLHLGPAGEQRADDHRDGRGRDLVGQQVGLGAMVDHQVIAELPGHPHRGRDIVRAVAVLPPRDFPAQHPAERLQLQVAVHRRPFGRRAVRSRRQLRLVVLGGDERAADHRGGAQPGRRGLVALAVDALGVLAERGLQPGRLAEHHLVHGAAPALDRDGLAADRVGRARVDVDREHAAGDGVAEAQVGRVDRVERADLGGDRIGPLVGVLARPALGLLVHAGVGVGVDEAGQHPLPGRVDHVGAVRHREARTLDRRDLPVPQQDGPAVHRVALDRYDSAPGNRDGLRHAPPPHPSRRPTLLTRPC